MTHDTHDRLKTLIASAREGNNEAFETLVVLYGPLLQKHVGMYSARFSYNELYAEACEALLDAVMHWNTDGGAHFSRYAQTCVSNRLKRFYRLHCERQEELPLEEHTFEADCEDDIIRLDALERLLAEIRRLASPLEFRVFSYYFRGYTSAEIASRLCVKEKDVTNAKTRLFTKLRKAAGRLSDLM